MRARDHKRWREVVFHEGVCYFMLAHFGVSLRCFLSVLKSAQKDGDMYFEAKALYWKSLILLVQERPSEAVFKNMRAALDLSKDAQLNKVPYAAVLILNEEQRMLEGSTELSLADFRDLVERNLSDENLELLAAGRGDMYDAFTHFYFADVLIDLCQTDLLDFDLGAPAANEDEKAAGGLTAPRRFGFAAPPSLVGATAGSGTSPLRVPRAPLAEEEKREEEAAAAAAAAAATGLVASPSMQASLRPPDGTESLRQHSDPVSRLRAPRSTIFRAASAARVVRKAAMKYQLDRDDVAKIPMARALLDRAQRAVRAFGEFVKVFPYAAPLAQYVQGRLEQAQQRRKRAKALWKATSAAASSLGMTMVAGLAHFELGCAATDVKERAHHLHYSAILFNHCGLNYKFRPRLQPLRDLARARSDATPSLGQSSRRKSQFDLLSHATVRRSQTHRPSSGALVPLDASDTRREVTQRTRRLSEEGSLDEKDEEAEEGGDKDAEAGGGDDAEAASRAPSDAATPAEPGSPNSDGEEHARWKE
jgi:hypothetical protein